MTSWMETQPAASSAASAGCIATPAHRGACARARPGGADDMAAMRYSQAAKARALQQVHALAANGYSRRGAVQHVAKGLGCRSETLNAWLRREASQQRGNVHHDVHGARLRQLERELQELRRLTAALQRALRAALDAKGEDASPKAPTPSGASQR